MSAKEIPNWCGTKPITAYVASPATIAKYGPLVDITQNGGSMYFNHTMTPDQARTLAALLIELAAEAESIAAKEAA